MDYSKARSALVTQLHTIVGLPPVAYENMEFEEDPETMWLAINVLFGNSLGLDLKGNHDVTSGICQIDINAPVSQGIADSLSMLQKIKTAFKRGRYIYDGQKVEVTGHTVQQDNGMNLPFKTTIITIAFRVLQ